MWVGWRRLSTESAGVDEKRLWLTGLNDDDNNESDDDYNGDITSVCAGWTEA